eukprot:CAMPEP_0175146370 /NCGR_PEP_ID=MMETSP0087-20121206/15344_1 /TAXON_ID=136419 /ORGANISM="Unknown Unknown, Strain D1" /LENGTH=308 /DNA_ID=CAMNT_0016431331 /DNA_START=86 /DNA_END=1012 /DNA_ORIENTATION=+
MPLVGLGTWKISLDSTAETVYQSIKRGYRCLDCACDYGNEAEVGKGIKRAIDEGVVKREDLWITSKLWNTFHEKERVREGCEKTLKDLGLTYLDLYLVHFPISLKYVPIETRYPPEWFYDPSEKEPKCVGSNATIRETWEQMEALCQAGLAKNIGVANFNVVLLQDLFKYAKVPPNVLQVEHHPYLQQPVLFDIARGFGMAITAFSSFGAKSYWVFNEDLKKDQQLLDHPLVDAIAKKHSKTTAQVLLRFATQRDICVIPKSSNFERLSENLACCGFALDEKDMADLKGLECNRRFNDVGGFGYPIYS